MYKRRSLLKNVISGTSTYCSGAPTNKLKLEKALIVSKLSHFEFEQHRHKQLNESQLERKLTSRGTDYEKLIYYHNLHKKFERNMVGTLKDMGIHVKVVNRFNYTEDYINWADVIIPTGGDGTFLLAASRILNNEKPVIGFNSDPNRSEGHLCLPKAYSYNIEEAVKRLQSGKFQWLLRSRIRTTLIGCKGDIIPKHLHETHDGDNLDTIASQDAERTLPCLALNEVFIGESLSARVSHLEMCLNGEVTPTNMKCSGLCVCTGTGSTSWHLSINRLPVHSVAELLRLLDMDPTEDQHSLATVLSDLYTKRLVFSSDNKSMGYTIRDLISASVWPKPKGIKSRGFAKKIQVKSKFFDGCLVIDGGVSYAFNDGTVAVLEIHPEDSLRTVIFTA